MLDLLNKAMRLSKEITELFDREEWDKAQQLQQQRELLLNQLPNTELPSDSHALAKINTLSIEIKTITKEQLVISTARKDALLQQIKNNNRSKKMKTAYGD